VPELSVIRNVIQCGLPKLHDGMEMERIFVGTDVSDRASAATGGRGGDRHEICGGCTGALFHLYSFFELLKLLTTWHAIVTHCLHENLNAAGGRRLTVMHRLPPVCLPCTQNRSIVYRRIVAYTIYENGDQLADQL